MRLAEIFLGRRWWAVQVIDRMGMFAGTRKATVLIDMLIWAANTDSLEMRGFGKKRRDQILGWAIIMFNNPTATEKLARDARISEQEAYSLLLAMKEAARKVAADEGLETLVYIADESDSW